MTDKFKTLTSTCIPLPMENVDTDQIIPARFLKATTREGFGDNLFRDWRYDKEGNPIPGSHLLRHCFGCGKKFRKRIESRTCRMGCCRIWIQSCRFKFFCRYF